MATEDCGLVVITGANGTIGYASVVYALQKGYRVRCILRREGAIPTIQAGPSVQQYAHRIEYAVVPDNTVTGAYDWAIAGADYVVHIAGVWPKPDYHPDRDIYLPFVKSMENILSAAEKAGTVRRIVFTQAGAAFVNPDDGDTLGTAMAQVLHEYAPVNPQSASFRPPLASSHHAYSGAKAQCMTYLKSLRDSGALPFSVVQVIPGTVIGPSELITTASEALQHMDRMSTAFLFEGMRPRYAFGFVHVKDCAKVHIEALDEKAVLDQSVPDWFIAAAPSEKGKSGEELWKSTADALAKAFPEEIQRGLFQLGRDNMPINMPFHVDSSITEKTLFGGAKFKTLAESVAEVAHWYMSLADTEHEQS